MFNLYIYTHIYTEVHLHIKYIYMNVYVHICTSLYICIYAYISGYISLSVSNFLFCFERVKIVIACHFCSKWPFFNAKLTLTTVILLL